MTEVNQSRMKRARLSPDSFLNELHGVISAKEKFGFAVLVVQLNRSLLAIGVRGVRGEFRAGDAIAIEGADGKEIARGLVQYDAREMRRIAGKHSHQIEDLVGHSVGDEVVHRDDLVVL